MKQIRSLLATSLLLVFNTSWGNVNLELDQGFTFTKYSSTIENLDRNKFKGTNYTSDWSSTRDFTTYLLRGEAIWIDQCTNFYGLVSASYGWVLGGRLRDYPLGWKIHGNTQNYKFETGYIYNVCKQFDFIPHIGFQYQVLDTKIRDQHFIHKSPDSTISHNGDKSHTRFWAPFIGFEVAFESTFCNCYKLDFSASYDFYYGGGHGRLSVPHFFVTDIPNTSRYGNRIKYHDIISHEVEFTVAHNFTDHFQSYLEFDYINSYNTHKLPVKLQHNKKIVATGQFTRTQYHVMSDYHLETYRIILGLVYKFGAKTSGVLVR